MTTAINETHLEVFPLLIVVKKYTHDIYIYINIYIYIYIKRSYFTLVHTSKLAQNGPLIHSKLIYNLNEYMKIEF